MAEGVNLKMSASYPDNGIYELMTSYTDNYFYVHPIKNDGDTKYYVRRGASDGYAILSTTPSEWSFGLSVDQLKPYFDRKGYVGGLKADVYGANTTLVEAINSTPTDEQLVAIQALVYTDSNIQPYAPGYYRLHSQPDIPSVTTPRYASGYLHEIEKTAGDGGTSIPMHFYSKKGVTTTFGALSTGFTSTDATRGDIPILATENDPSTIFYFYENVEVTDAGKSVNAVPTSRVMTQGLYAKEAVMTESDPGESARYYIMDIGGATLLIHDGAAPADRKYLCFDQTDASTIYDLQFKHDTPTDDAKWCMEPANNQGLELTLNDGGDSHYYTTVCLPYDILLPDATKDAAYVCTAWDSKVMYPKAVGDLNTGDYTGNSLYIPAGTPAIIRSTTGTSVTATIPTTSPAASPLSCVFTGQYLEQKLANEGYEIYTFGLPFTSTVSKANDYATTGDITATSPTKATTGVGFYINANQNKEIDGSSSSWTRNNWYVLHNKIYYRASVSGSAIEFVPMDFTGIKDLDGYGDEDSSAKAVAGDGRVYNMRGQCVATGQEAADGSWMLRVPHGVYILNGKKILVK